MTARPSTIATARRSVSRVHVVEQHRVDAERSSASASWSSVSTSSSILTRWPACGARPLQRRADAAGHRDVVVLDQHRVVEAEAVVGAAARRAPRTFSSDAQAGGGLAGADDLAPCARRPHRPATRVAVATPDRRQRRFSAVRSAARTARAGPRCAATVSPRCDAGAVRRAARSMRRAGSSSSKASSAGVEPGEHAGLARRDHRLDARVGGHDRVGGDVAGAAEIFQQRGADDRLDEEPRAWSCLSAACGSAPRPRRPSPRGRGDQPVQPNASMRSTGGGRARRSPARP